MIIIIIIIIIIKYVCSVIHVCVGKKVKWVKERFIEYLYRNYSINNLTSGAAMVTSGQGCEDHQHPWSEATRDT